MEILKQKFATLQKALTTLKKSVSRHAESVTYPQERFEEYRDSLIQRFEYCTDLLWKVIKDYLAKKEGIQVASPKSVFRACYTIKLLTEEEAEAFLIMIDARNTTSHIYREEFADSLYKKIPEFYEQMQTLVNKVTTSLENPTVPS